MSLNLILIKESQKVPIKIQNLIQNNKFSLYSNSEIEQISVVNSQLLRHFSRELFDFLLMTSQKYAS